VYSPAAPKMHGSFAAKGAAQDAKISSAAKR
jgi:hypothetical protein